jgi:hypothetical protein
MPVKKNIKQLKAKKKKQNSRLGIFTKVFILIISIFALFSLIFVSANKTTTHSDASFSGISLVQSNTGKSNSETASVNLENATSGNLIVAAVSVYQGTITVTDSKGNIYKKAVEIPSTGSDRVAIYYAENINGGSVVVSAKSNARNTAVTVSAHEYSGIAVINALDKTKSRIASSKSTAIDSGTMDPTSQTDELVFGAFSFNNSTTITATVGSGMTMRQSQGNNSNYQALFTADKNVSLLGSYNAMFAASKSVNWSAVVASFKAATVLSPTSTPTLVPSNTPTSSPSGTTTPDPTQAVGCTQQDIQNLVNSVSQANITANLKELVQDDSKPTPNELISRKIGTAGNTTKTNWINQTVAGYGLQTKLQAFTSKKYNLNNVIATIPGTNPKSIYGAGGHFDSKADDSSTVAPGADDNGSGTVVWMEVARVLKGFQPCMKSSVDLVGFNDEEVNGKGSATYTKSVNSSSGKTMKGFYNMDMVGYTPTGECLKSDSNLSVDVPIAHKLLDINTKYNVGLSVSNGTYDVNDIDNVDFWNNNLPSAYLVECVTETDATKYPGYHSKNDKTSYINFAQLTKVAKLLVGTLAELSSQ